ncbi:4'-phosphopantetheinyl transferase superfamily protein [Candidatus Acetothermia bacterium]|jgi:4'-phosphopantetheinyl transferase|nr:4'-phosphopantetheinyl transferase superfamily protein [Candidatus Acetothermia bacterium]MCI2432277.1 4'-phosphopantetheinyl transferase superfamily protein [Candidatus Acetothermia bacterium]MCI2437402.1 4'-phosphopantetheinyl transferase superfamily protein [Candidatus Acetothermia bacterium]
MKFLKLPNARLCFVRPSSQPITDLLTPQETLAFQRIAAPARREDWLAGRRAAKELIRRSLLEAAGLELAPSQIEIVNDESGAPILTSPLPDRERVQGEGFPCPLGKKGAAGLGPTISLAHSAGHGLAGLTTHGSIGVDLQQIRPVRADLSERVLSEHERDQLAHYFPEHRSEGLLVFWTLKEAAIKAWRTRPAPALREIAVRLTEPGDAEICTRFQKLTACWGRWRGFIWAWAVG